MRHMRAFYANFMCTISVFRPGIIAKTIEPQQSLAMENSELEGDPEKQHMEIDDMRRQMSRA